MCLKLEVFLYCLARHSFRFDIIILFKSKKTVKTTVIYGFSDIHANVIRGKMIINSKNILKGNMLLYANEINHQQFLASNANRILLVQCVWFVNCADCRLNRTIFYWVSTIYFYANEGFIYACMHGNVTG